jgi:hypothetical protein
VILRCGLQKRGVGEHKRPADAFESLAVRQSSRDLGKSIRAQGESIMAGQVQGKIASVTGGGSGIGRATAIALAREGAKVMIADYVPEGGDRTVKMIKEKGGEASFIMRTWP